MSNQEQQQQHQGHRAPPIDKALYREYRNALGKLTFNSRPIINDLSRKAEAHVDQSETIIKAIEDHLRFTVPKLKLPTFYLLDSIIKNVGGMYVSNLHGRIDRIFMEMYRSVDDKVKNNMERTLGTWRHGFVGGHKNVFPDFVLRKIEEDLSKLKARARSTGDQRIPEMKSDDLLDNLSSMQSYAKKRALEQKEEVIQRAVLAKADGHSSPNGARSHGNGNGIGIGNGNSDGINRHHHHHHGHGHGHQPPAKRQRTPERAEDSSSHGLLQEVNRLLLKKKVELLRRPNDVILFTVLNTLKDIKTIVAETELTSERINEIRQQLGEMDQEAAAPKAGETAKFDTGSTTPPYAPPGQNVSGGTAQTASAMNGSERAADGGGAAGDPNQLLQNLMAKTDFINSLSKVAPGLSSSLGALLVPQRQPGSDGYKSFEDLEPIPLTNASITRIRPGIYDILYAGYPNLCSQCGWRVADNAQGNEEMQKHMDWHFRRNMRSQDDRVRRAAARGWYIEQSKWEAGKVFGDEDDTEGKEEQDTQGAEKAMVEELQKMTVAVSTHSNEPCAICKEAFERRFNEDEEEWEFVNAVVVDGAIYHATCHANSGGGPAAKPLGPVAASA
ncbi:mRNA 3' end processing factor [Coemansia spiralis]|uniref:mRNA 3' end processing factor n=2 Tax=Coemansia TaxID=4863 RepID=A0A9W8G246_9FUNG|nr:mRNA 3' end processing factor [Coemansia umbellata]KAJ2619866.1 mRNA 3' end processing factor [Coemansia sp. RSA 1358]KAJ2670806.1 mRNA 3' end processing factor [Coemansia spiralis]